MSIRYIYIQMYVTKRCLFFYLLDRDLDLSSVRLVIPIGSQV